jgi:uncharacterized membrane protein (UPF0136 family)
MGKICGTVTGLLFVVAGIVFYMFGTGGMDTMTAHQISGVLFVIAGIAFIVHTMEKCPICNAEMKK